MIFRPLSSLGVGPGLAAEAEGLDELGVALFGGVTEVIQMAAALSDGAEEAPAGGEILLVGGEMRREVKDALGESGGLVIGTASVFVVELIVLEIDIRIYGDAAHCCMVILKFPAAGVDSYRPFPPFGKAETLPQSPEPATEITGFKLRRGRGGFQRGFSPARG